MEKFLQGSHVIGVGGEFKMIDPSSAQSFLEFLAVFLVLFLIFFPKVSTRRIEVNFFTGFAILQINQPNVWDFQFAGIRLGPSRSS